MKKYLLGFLILGVMVALSPAVYADWAEVSESSTRDVEWAGEIKAEPASAKEIGDLKLRQLSEQAEGVTATAISAAALSVTASAAVVEVSNASQNDSFAGRILLADTDTDRSGIGSMGGGGDSDNPPADIPPADNPVIIDPRDIPPEDIVPSIPAMPKDPDGPLEAAVQAVQ